MRQTTKRVAALLLTLLLLAPAAIAVPVEESPISFFTALWEELVEGVSALFAGSETELGPTFDPNGDNLGPAIDPNGEASTTEDEGELGPGFDPDG